MINEQREVEQETYRADVEAGHAVGRAKVVEFRVDGELKYEAEASCVCSPELSSCA